MREAARQKRDGKSGRCNPAEEGEKAPEYISKVGKIKKMLVDGKRG